jgi:hypothetical protein
MARSPALESTPGDEGAVDLFRTSGRSAGSATPTRSRNLLDALVVAHDVDGGAAVVGGVLTEAKGPAYATFVKGGRFVPWFRGADALASQAQRQLAAAGGTPIRWAVTEPEAATAIRGLFRSRGISGINVTHVPPH